MISFVYLIGPEPDYPGSLIKIGVTTDLQKRLQTFQSGSPLPLAVKWAVPGDRSLELWLHQEFSSERRHGEWFDLGPDPIETIQEKVGPYLINVVLSQVGAFPITVSAEDPIQGDLDSDDLDSIETPEDQGLTIPQIAELTGIPASTLRTWKHRGHTDRIMTAVRNGMRQAS